jgi:hypothetical protein
MKEIGDGIANRFNQRNGGSNRNAIGKRISNSKNRGKMYCGKGKSFSHDNSSGVNLLLSSFTSHNNYTN